MKHLFLTALIIISSNAFASKIEPIKSLTKGTLENSRLLIASTDIVTHSGIVKVLELRGNGKTAQEIRQNTIAQVLHSVCQFFDEGVSLRLNPKTSRGVLRALTDFTESSNATEGDANYNKIAKAISTIISEADVELFSGYASGNNTAGNVLGLYDLKNNEIAVFANTNCGSDN